MPSQSAAPARIPGYDLPAPREADALAALQRVFDAERGAELWSRACRFAGLVPGQVTSTIDLERVARALGDQGGAASTVAHSITIRLRTYARLAARTAGRTGAPS